MAGEQRTRLGDEQPDVPERATSPSTGSGESDKPGKSQSGRRFAAVHRFRARIRRRRALDLAWRAGVLVVGVLILLAGLAMLALPGPGWAAIFVGLAVLATEFEWAHRLLHRAKERVQAAAHKAKDPKRRRLLLVLGGVLLVAGAGVGWWYVDRYGWALPW